MAEMEELKDKKKIPLFTVLKNGSILKNMFLLHDPPLFCTQESSNQEFGEEILFIGRHPHCNIKLEHPSISRFHLRIRSNPSSHMLSVTDLSSVHGTSVSGKKIEPGVEVKLKEGDTVRMGGSSRVYELHWVPLSRAYDIDDPFVPSAYRLKDEEKPTHQDENGPGLEKLGTQLLLDDLQSLNSSFSNENQQSPMKKLSPLTAAVPSLLNLPCDDIDMEDDYHMNAGTGDGEIPCTYRVQETTKELLDQQNENSQAFVLEAISALECSVNLSDSEKTLNWSLKGNDVVDMADELELLNLGNLEDESASVANFNCVIGDDEATFTPYIGVDAGSEVGQKNQKRMEESGSVVLSDAADKAIQEELSTSVVPGNEVVMGVDVGCEVEQKSQKIMKKSGSAVLSEPADKVQEEFSTSVVPSNEVVMGVKFEPFDQEKVNNKLVSVAPSDGIAKDEEGTFTPEISSSKKVHMDSVLKLLNCEPMKNKSVLMACVDGLDRKGEETFSPDKENINSNTYPLKSMEKREKEDVYEQSDLLTMPLKKAESPTIIKEKDILGFYDEESPDNVLHELIAETPFSNVEENEDVSTPPSENSISQTLPLGSMKKIDKVGETKCSNPHDAPTSTNAVGSSINRDEVMFSAYSDKENQTPCVVQPSCNSMSYPQTTERVIDPPFHFSGEEKKRWTMVVDTNCFLQKDSMKHLKILQGTRGTQLFVPRIVIKELMDMKEHTLLKTPAEVYLALKWIEECTVSARWWINVQSSMEEIQANSPVGVLHLDSTAEPQVLECAIHLRTALTDQHVIILSNDLMLKIKAMEKGIVCESAEQFRKSLVNPFSERFLWMGSSARGLTWCGLDDVVLRETYYSCPLIKAYGLKGLKLLTRNNSLVRSFVS